MGGGSGEVSVITTAEAGQHFVSIDGKRTYINLFNTSPPPVPLAPTQSKPIIKPTGYETLVKNKFIKKKLENQFIFLFLIRFLLYEIHLVINCE